MKNIHIIATDKPSRLGYLTKKGKQVFNDLRLFNRVMPNILDSENQHLYITNSEEVKEGDWIFNEEREPSVLQCIGKGSLRGWNKIILTTDQDLIKDGVQAIDDEFLEWFVKNPSCEFVEVQDMSMQYHEEDYHEYKIIIPQEEPKQEWNPTQGEEVWIKVFSNWSKGIYIGYDVTKETHIVREDDEGGGHLMSSSQVLPYCEMPNKPKQEEPKQELPQLGTKEFNDLASAYFEGKLNHLASAYFGGEPKQETLEEANWKVLGTKKDTFYNGAKWQAERMYSEEEVFNLLCKIPNYFKMTIAQQPEAIKDWFEQFKKK